MVGIAQFAGRVDVLYDHVVVYGHVARRLVGYVYIVTLLHEADERTAHRDDVIVGVRREDHHAFGEGLRRYGTRRVVGIGFAARPARDGVLQVVEDVDVDLVERTALFEQFAQRVFDIVLVGKLQDRLLDHAAEPYDGLADEFRGPFAGSDHPRGLLAGEQLSGVFVDHHLDVRVGLQVGGGDHFGDLALDHLLDDAGLLLAPGHEDDAVGAHDRVDTHRDGHLGGVLQSEEGARLDLAGVVGQLDQPGARTRIGARFVETDLTVLAHADDHQVDVAYGQVIRGAVLRNALLGHRTVRNVDILGQDVDVVEEVLVDAEVAALLFGGLDRVELVEAVDGHVLEADLPLLVTFDQFAVETQRGAARRETQDEGLRLFVDLVRGVDFVVGADGLHDRVGHVLYTLVFVFVDPGVDFFVAMDDVARSRVGDQAAVFRQGILVVHFDVMNCIFSVYFSKMTRSKNSGRWKSGFSV